MRIGTSYFANRIVRHVREDMNLLARQGFNLVVHTMSEYDLAFHTGQMKDIVDASHDAGLEVYIDPWGVGNVFGGEPFSNFVAQNSLEGCQILDDGKPGAFACPNNPMFHEFMRRWTEAALQTGAEYVFWDEPHYHNASFLGGRPGRWGCRCRHCQTKYEASHDGAPMPLQETDDVKSFKMDCLRDFLQMLMGWVAGAGRKNALCLAPHEAPDHVHDRWMRFASIPTVSVVGTDPYWLWHKQPVEIVADYSRAIRRLCEEVGKEPQIWIQVCKIPKGRETEVARAIELAAGEGIRNLAAWGFEACANESWLQCEDPETAWATAIQAFAKVKAANPA